MKNGTSIPSTTPYGYVMKDREFHIVEQEAEIVRLIFMSHLSDMDAPSFGQNAYRYDAAEGLLTVTILPVAEFCETKKRHIVSVFKIIQKLLSPQKKGKNQFRSLMEMLPDDHKAKWFAGAAQQTHTSE